MDCQVLVLVGGNAQMLIVVFAGTPIDQPLRWDTGIDHGYLQYQGTQQKAKSSHTHTSQKWLLEPFASTYIILMINTWFPIDFSRQPMRAFTQVFQSPLYYLLTTVTSLPLTLLESDVLFHTLHWATSPLFQSYISWVISRVILFLSDLFFCWKPLRVWFLCDINYIFSWIASCFVLALLWRCFFNFLDGALALL